MIRTAGMAKGTPDWQLDRMYETDTEKVLEKAYADDVPVYEVTDKIGIAYANICSAVTALCRAADIADKLGKAENLDKLIERLEDLQTDVKAEKLRLEGRSVM